MRTREFNLADSDHASHSRDTPSIHWEAQHKPCQQECPVKEIRSYFLERMLETALRRPQGVLPYPYLVPGGSGYSHTMWDWDAFFLGVGLLSARPDLATYLEGTARNFLHISLPDGFIPNNVEADGKGFITLTRAGQPMNPAKPVIAQMLATALRISGTLSLQDQEWDRLKLFQRHWELNLLHGSRLYRVNSHRGSGPDNDPSVYGRPYRSTALTLVNALMVRELESMAEVADRYEPSAAESYRVRADELRAAIRDRMWDEEDAIYYSQDVSYETPHIGLGVRQHTETWSTTLKVRTGSAFAMLWAGVPKSEEASALVSRYVTGGSDLYGPWGVRSLSNRDRLFNNTGITDPLNIPDDARAAGFVPLTPFPSGNPSNWQGPVWIINNYLLYRGLRRYGYTEEASRLFSTTSELLARDITTNGTSHENYHSETGQGLAHTDFMCWNLCIFAMEAEEGGETSVETAS